MGKGTPLLHDAKPLKQRLLCCEASYEIFFWPRDEQVILQGNGTVTHFSNSASELGRSRSSANTPAEHSY